ncbi:DUF4376 domain-containing protein [Vibrio owensii]|uniref:DUF4376 domain-containing protein n=1 Tax=Vibrio owensii TaxID=696485 RepID=A0AAP9GFB3_9VIBR|nr:DUF4376 domain-containing protein [Vibrio owensii]QGH49243.1 DUF4376 domain-containing protein [Vibrio owensii]
MMIDTDYTSLTEIDPEIVRFYSEDWRETIAFDIEGNEVGRTPYLVIVLNKPEPVTFDDVAQRRAERKPWESVVKPELERAIEWEDFSVNHDQYLIWQDELALWQHDRPHVEVVDDDGEVSLELAEPPVRPAINIDDRRKVYESIVIECDPATEIPTDEFEIEYDDTELIVTNERVSIKKPANQIADYYRSQAVVYREAVKLSNILVNGHYYQVGKADRDNMNETISYAERQGMMDQTTTWITADNDFVTMTFSELQEIKDAYTMRMERLFVQFKEWAATGMQTPFEYVEADS